MLKYRENVKKDDIFKIKKLLENTGFFYDYEISVGVELLEDKYEKGEKSDYLFLILEENDEILAYSCFGKIPCTESSYDLYWIAVEKKYQNLAYGSKILKETEMRIKNLEGKRIYIETSSSDMYIKTVGFYKKNNYKVEAVIKDFYKDGDDKLIFSKFV